MDLVYNERTHVYSIDGVKIPSVTQVLESVGITDFSMVPTDLLREKSHLGKIVHRATELYDQGILDESTVDQEVKPYLEGWKKFRSEVPIKEWLLIEIPIVSEKYRFAGTPDRVALMGNGRIALLDIKSGVPVKGTAIQTGGYKILYDEGKKVKEKIKERIAVRLLMNGTYRLSQYGDASDMTVFKGALSVTNWKRR